MPLLTFRKKSTIIRKKKFEKYGAFGKGGIYKLDMRRKTRRNGVKYGKEKLGLGEYWL